MTSATDSPDIFQIALSYINYTDKNLFITGKAGTGKTTFLKKIRETTSKSYVITAPTGVAAINAQGVTVNSFFQLPPGYFVSEYQQLPSNFYHLPTIVRDNNFSLDKKTMLQELDLLIIDEVSMLRCDQIDAIDSLLKAVRKNDRPFGGVQLLLMGDLFQLPPVVKNGDWVTLHKFYVSCYFFDAHIIKAHPLIQIEFTKVFRQSETIFIDILNEIRSNQISDVSLDRLNERFNSVLESGEIANYITITSHKAEANALNEQALSSIGAKEYISEGIIKGDFKEYSFPVEKYIKLKEGARVMLTKNDTGDLKRFYNGKIGIISQINADTVVVSFPGEAPMVLEKSVWYTYDYKTSVAGGIELIQTGEFIQYPIQLAWAVTIHKCQGLTFDHAIIDAANSFEAGQVYVALSRVKSLSGLVLYSKITKESIQYNQNVLKYVNIQREYSLKSNLDEEVIKFFIKSISGPFCMKMDIEFVEDYLKKISVLQRSEHKTTIFVEQVISALNIINKVCKRFQLEIFNISIESDAIDIEFVNNRIIAASTYFIIEIESQLINPILDFIPNLKNTKEDQQAKQVLRNIILKLKYRQQRMQLSTKVATNFAVHNSFITAIDQLNEHQTINAKSNENGSNILTDKKQTLSKSISKTIGLFKKGYTLSEIANLRKISIYTVENHFLECVKLNKISISQLLQENRIQKINEEIQAIGTDIYALKERLGEEFSFYEIRLIMNRNLRT